MMQADLPSATSRSMPPTREERRSQTRRGASTIMQSHDKPRQAKPAKPSKPAKRNKKEFGPKDANGDPNIFDTMAMCEGREGRKGSPISIWCLEDGQELMGLRPRIGFGGLRDKDCWSGKNVYPIVPELPSLQSRSF